MRTPHITRTSALAVVLTLTMGLGACAQTEGEPAELNPNELSFGHVHGLATNSTGDLLYVATHGGLFVIDNARTRQVGANRHDLMGFTSAGPDRFIASGHPEGVELPEPMGLVASDDGGTTWTRVSLSGRADLHSIDASGAAIVAYDSTTESVISSKDSGRTFQLLVQMPAVDVTLMASGDVLVTGPDGTATLVDGSDNRTKPEPIPAAPALTFVDGLGSTLVGLGPAGQVWVSDEARTWTGRTAVPGQPQAIEITAKRWYVATTTGLYASDDDGATWEPVT